MKSLCRATVLGLGLLVLVAGLTGLTGCSSSDNTTGSTTATPASNDFVGTWALHEGSLSSGIIWYANFRPDKTFDISDNADGTRVRVSGTYTVTDGFLVGPFVNPGVGNGRVEATIANNIIDLDFIEYWHTPNKVIPYVGRKI